MADWRNRMDMIVNKIKTQMNSRGVDNSSQLTAIFNVSCLLAP